MPQGEIQNKINYNPSKKTLNNVWCCFRILKTVWCYGKKSSRNILGKREKKLCGEIWTRLWLNSSKRYIVMAGWVQSVLLVYIN